MCLRFAGADNWREGGTERLIHEADVTLKRAKSLGRNLVGLAKPALMGRLITAVWRGISPWASTVAECPALLS